jgi:hypothetical protein
MICMYSPGVYVQVYEDSKLIYSDDVWLSELIIHKRHYSTHILNLRNTLQRLYPRSILPFR